MSKTTRFNMQPGLVRDVEIVAAKTGRSFREVVSQAVRHYGHFLGLTLSDGHEPPSRGDLVREALREEDS